jgi:hypothetical protein
MYSDLLLASLAETFIKLILFLITELVVRTGVGIKLTRTLEIVSDNLRVHEWNNGISMLESPPFKTLLWFVF